MATQKEIKSTLIRFYEKPIAKVSLELFLSVGAVIFFAVFAIRPTLLTMSDLIKEIEDKTKLDQQLAQKAAALSTVQAEYLQLEDRLVVLDEAIPATQPEFDKNLKIIEKIASDNQLVISSIQVSEIPKDEDPEIEFSQRQRITVPISVTVTGDYLKIKSFIDQLGENRRALIVESVVFSVNETRDTKSLRANVVINMHYYGAGSTYEQQSK